MKTEKHKKTAREKAARKILNEASVGIAMAGPEILAFQTQVAQDPQKFFQLFSKTNPPSKIPRIEVGNIHPILKETQEKILEQTCERIETLSQGKISKKDLEAGIKNRCLSRTISILYSTVYQNEEGRKRLYIIEHAGEEFQKEEGGTGIRAGSLCYSFLRQNGLTKKISHRDMAVELKTAFEEIFQKTRDRLESDGYDINETHLKRFLASELFRRSGGRTNKGFLISNAKEAARRFTERVEMEKKQLQAVMTTLSMTAAANQFVQDQVNTNLKNHLLNHPLKPVFERNHKGGVLLHPQTGTPILNEDLPEKWRKSEANSPIEDTFQSLPQNDKKEEIAALLDILRIPRKLNIPLQVAMDEIQEAFPNLPEILQKGLIAEQTRLAYEITKSSHSVAYKLGIIIAASKSASLSEKASKTLESMQNTLEKIASKKWEETPYWKVLGGNNPETTWNDLEDSFQESKTLLSLFKGSPTLPNTEEITKPILPNL